MRKTKTNESYKRFNARRTLLTILTVLFCMFLTLGLTACSSCSSCGKKPDSDNPKPDDGTITESQTVKKIKEALEYQDIVMVDLDGAKTYDLQNVIPDYDLDYLEDIDGTLVWELLPMNDGTRGYSSNSSIVDFNTVDKAYYAVVVYDDYNGVKTPIYAIYADFYDRYDGFVWNDYTYTDADTNKIILKSDVISTDATILYDIDRYYADTTTATTVTAGIGPDGTAGNWYKIESNTSDLLGYSEGVWATFAPKHSRDYYVKYYNLNYEISYSYAIYGEDFFTIKDGTPVSAENVYGVYVTSVGKANATASESYKRYQFGAPFNGTTLRVASSTVSLNSYTNEDWYYMFHKEFRWFQSNAQGGEELYAGKTTVYFGNFSIKATTEPKVETDDLGLIDVKKTTSINIKDKLTDAEYYTIFKVTGNISTELTDFDYSSDTIDLTKLNGYYVVKGYNKYHEIIKQVKFDVYKSSVLEWGSDIRFEMVNGSGVTGKLVDIATDNAELGRTGEYMKVTRDSESAGAVGVLTVQPIHSKAYYEMFGDDLDKVKISYDFYVEAQSSQTDKKIIIMNNFVAQDDNFDAVDFKFKHNQIFTFKWDSRTVSLSMLIEYWDRYTTGTDYMIALFGTENAFCTAKNDDGTGVGDYISGGVATYTVYFGNVRIEPEVSVPLESEAKGIIDADETSISLEFLSDVASKKLYKVNGEEKILVDVDLSSATLDVSTFVGAYVVIGYDTDGIALKTITFDKKGGEVPEVGGVENAKFSGYDDVTLNIESITGKDFAGDRTGDYIKVEKSDANSTGVGILSLSAIHGKDFYAAIEDLSSYQLKYDYYIIANVEGQEVTILNLKLANDANYTVNNNFKAGQSRVGAWFTCSVTLDKILGNDYNKFVSATDSDIFLLTTVNAFCVTGDPATEEVENSYYVNKGTFTIYIGNFRVEKVNTTPDEPDNPTTPSDALDAPQNNPQVPTDAPALTVNTQVFATTTLVDLKTYTGATYDVSTLMTDNKNYLDEYKDYVVTYFTDLFGNEVITLGTSIDVSRLLKRAYTVQVKIGNAVLMEGTFDFYNSDDGFVWGDYLNENQLIVRGVNYIKNETSSASVVDITTTEIAGDRTGYYYKVNTNGTRATVSVKPVHSKAYYELFDGNATLSIDVYISDQEGKVVDRNEVRLGVFSADAYRKVDCDKWLNYNYGIIKWQDDVDNVDNQKTLTVGDLINKYDFFMDGNMNAGTGICFFDFIEKINSTFNANNVWLTVYIGNIKLVSATTAE